MYGNGEYKVTTTKTENLQFQFVKRFTFLDVSIILIETLGDNGTQFQQRLFRNYCVIEVKVILFCWFVGI